MNIQNKKITVLGAGVSGIGAAQLANYLGAIVHLSDSNNIKITNKLLEKISFEFNGHSKKCYESDLVIISPGINENITIVKEFYNKNIPIISEVEFAYRFTAGTIISVTGSNGKSTTVKLLEKIFKNKYCNTLLGGNIGTSFSSNVLKELKKDCNCILHDPLPDLLEYSKDERKKF